MLAGAGQPLDDLLDDARIELAGGEIVQEKQRLRALHGDVVDAVIDQALADGVVLVQGAGDVELGAHSVRRGDQHGLAEALRAQRIGAAESADAGGHVAGERRPGVTLEAFDGALRLVDGDAGGGVSRGAPGRVGGSWRADNR